MTKLKWGYPFCIKKTVLNFKAKCLSYVLRIYFFLLWTENAICDEVLPVYNYFLGRYQTFFIKIPERYKQQHDLAGLITDAWYYASMLLAKAVCCRVYVGTRTYFVENRKKAANLLDWLEERWSPKKRQKVFFNYKGCWWAIMTHEERMDGKICHVEPLGLRLALIHL